MSDPKQKNGRLGTEADLVATSTLAASLVISTLDKYIRLRLAQQSHKSDQPQPERIEQEQTARDALKFAMKNTVQQRCPDSISVVRIEAE